MGTGFRYQELIFISLQVAKQGAFMLLGRLKQTVVFPLLCKAGINAPLMVLLPIWMDTVGVFAAEAVSQLTGRLLSAD